MKIAIILEGTRVSKINVPWITPENWDKIATEANSDEFRVIDGYRGTWKKVGNEYRIYITKER